MNITKGATAVTPITEVVYQARDACAQIQQQRQADTISYMAPVTAADDYTQARVIEDVREAHN